MVYCPRAPSRSLPSWSQPITPMWAFPKQKHWPHLQRRSPVLVSSRTCKPCRTHWISHAPLGLRCCIYGMAQAGRRWQRTLFPWLEEFGFKKCEHDSCIFKCEKEVITPDGPRNEVLTLGVYVDDLVTLYFHDDEHSLYHQFATELQKWDVEDEGELTDLLGVSARMCGGRSLPVLQSIYFSIHTRLRSSRDARSAPALLRTTCCMGGSIIMSPDRPRREKRRARQRLDVFCGRLCGAGVEALCADRRAMVL